MSAESNNSGYGRVPSWIAPSGIIGQLNERELRVYLALTTHVNRQTWSCYPRVNTIANEAGVKDRTAQRALRGLETKGLITVDRGGGRENTSLYTLVTKGDTRRVTLSGQKGCHEDAKGCQDSPETPSNGGRKGDTSGPKRCHPGDTRTKEQIEQIPLDRTEGENTVS